MAQAKEIRAVSIHKFPCHGALGSDRGARSFAFKWTLFLALYGSCFLGKVSSWQGLGEKEHCIPLQESVVYLG